MSGRKLQRARIWRAMRKRASSSQKDKGGLRAAFRSAWTAPTFRKRFRKCFKGDFNAAQ